MADEFKIVASLNIPKSVDRINNVDIPKLRGQTKHLKIIADLDPKLSIKNIQATLNKMNNNANIKIGIDTSGLNSTINDVQNKIIATNNGLSIKPTVDGKVIEDTDVLIKTIVSKLQTLNTVDLKAFKDNLKNILGVSSKEISADADTLIQTLKLNPEDANSIIQSYENLMDSIRNTMSSMGKDKIVSGSSFDNNIVTSIYRAATEYNNLGQTATSTMANVKNATNSVVNTNTQVANSAKYIDTKYKTSFNIVSDVITQAETEFKKFGEVSAVSNKSVKAFEGVPEHFKDFTIQVKSATGTVQKFFYTFENVGDKDNPVFKYMLQNINEADAGVKKLTDDLEKAKATAQKTLAGFDNKSMGLFNQTDVYQKALQASNNITDFDSIATFNNAMAELEAHYQKITSYTRSGGKSLNPFINAVNDMAGMEEQIKRIKASADGLQNKSKSLIGNLGSLNRLADNVNKYAVGTEEWGQAYEKLKNKIAQVNDQIKTAKVEQKTTDSFAQKQQNMYSVIEQRMKQINQLKIQQLSTDEETSRIIQEQINSYTNQINGIKGNMSKYGYGDKTLDKEVEKLKVELDYKYRIAQSEKENRIQQQSNNELLKFQTDTLREINAEYEKIVANKKAMASTKSEENKSIYANRIAESEKIIANDMEMLKDANLLTEEINQQVASKRQYVSEQEKIIANTEQIKREQELNQVFKSQITEVEKYKNTITEIIRTLQNLQNSKTFTNNASNPQVTETRNKITALIAEYQKLLTQLDSKVTPTTLENLNAKLTQLNARFNDATTTAKRFETELRNDNGADQLAQKVNLLTSRIKAYRQANSKSEKMFGSQYDNILSQLANPNIDLNAYNALNKQFQKMRQEINSANVAGKNLWQTFKEKLGKFTGWMSMTYAVSLVTRTIRGMVTDVVELDTALIDLKKTFKGTNADLKEFYYEANNVAKQLGVTTQEVINTASSWSRLGYNTKEAAIEMSKYASMFKMISPNMSIEDSTDGLLSVMKAFDIEVNDVLDGVMSKINKVGNEFGTSNNEIVQMLMRSSSAMKEGNNTLAETIALETSAVEITRDYASVGTAYKTLAMRLRGYDEELETYSNDVQVLSGEIADLTKTAKNPSGVSLFKDEAKTEYKSTLEILRDIREVYDDLDDKTQAQLLEKIAGKRQGQIVAATLDNWDTVEKALVAMENADGNALDEMNTVMESISYRANIFRETLVGIAQGSFSQDFLTSMVDSGTRILNVFDDLSPSISFILEKFVSLLELVTKLADTIGGIPLLIAGIGLKNVGSPKMFGLVLICQQ